MTRLDTRTHRAWARDNPVLADGELVAEKETGRLKIGDGVTRYNLLPFVNPDATRDKIESKLYDPAYSWELVPGSDVPATTVGVLPKVSNPGDFVVAPNAAQFMGLVTVSADATAIPYDSAPFRTWYLDPVTTVCSVAGDNAASTLYSSGEHPAPGVYIGVYYSADGQPPYAFPEGWTPGNTTGSGPMLPLLGAPGGAYRLYGGLVEVDALSVVPPSVHFPLADVNGGWNLLPSTTPTTMEHATDSGRLEAGYTVPKGLYFGFYYGSSTNEPGAVPTDFPEGWSFHPYGLGQLALTDENVGGLIGDIAYVVSGWVWNAGVVNFTAHPEDWTNVQLLGVGSHTLNVGDKFATAVADPTFPDRSLYYTVTVAGTIIITATNTWSWQIASDNSFGIAVPTWVRSSYWPYIERFDMAKKKWLPRIPIEYAAEGGVGGIIDGKLYFGGGDGDDITGQEFFVFDPSDESIIRLADMPDNYPDYAPYGVVGGKLWYITGGKAVSYTPSTNTWIEHDYTFGDGGDGLDGYDQVAGYEWKDKLLFVLYEDAYIFDPTTLDIQYSGAPDGFSLMGSFFVNGQVECYEWDDNPLRPGVAFSKTGRKAIYDPDANTWTEKTDALNYLVSGATELVSVTYKNTPYVLSKVGLNTTIRGVYGRTGKSLVKPYLPLQEREVTAAQIQAALPKRAWNWMSLIVDIQGWGYDPNLPMHFAPYYSSPLSDGSVCKMYLTGFHHYTGDNQPSSISTATSVYFGGMNYDETMALIRDSTINSVELRLTDIDTGASISYRRNQQQPLFDSNAPDDADGNYRAHGLKLTTDADGATPHVDIPGAGGVHLTDGIVYDPTTRRFTNKPGYRGRVLWTLLVDAFAPHAYP